MTTPSKPPSHHPFLKKADHIILWNDDPQRLMDLFTRTLALPLAAAIDHYEDDTLELTSGGVSFGNLVMEVGIIPDVRERVASGPYFGGLAFQPTLDIEHTLASLLQRGIGSRGPYHFEVTPAADETQGWPFTGFSNVIIDSVLADPWVFVCEYHGRWYELYARFASKLRRREGGPLEVVEAIEVVFGVPDLDDAIERWQSLFDPVQPESPGFWRLGSGPGIRLVAATTQSIERLVIAVRSRERAEAFLREHHLPAKVIGADLVTYVDGSPAAAINFREVPDPARSGASHHRRS